MSLEEKENKILEKEKNIAKNNFIIKSRAFGSVSSKVSFRLPRKRSNCVLTLLQYFTWNGHLLARKKIPGHDDSVLGIIESQPRLLEHK